MGRLEESVLVGAPLAAVWDLYFDRRTWASWVDGFARVEGEHEYPRAGGGLVWRSTPAGRGEVRERVLEHAPRTLHRIEFSDPQSFGELESRFAVEGEATRVTLRLDYSLTGGRLLARLSDRLFVRGQLRGSLRRTLSRFKHEVEEYG